MERLTFRHDCPGQSFHDHAESCEPINCIDEYSVKARNAVVYRLAAYEDTGLAPEEIEHTLMNFSAFLMEMTGGTMSKTNYTVLNMVSEANEYFQKTCDECRDKDEMQSYRALGTVEELTVLVKGKAEGRVVLLDMPRKPLVWDDDDHDTCICPDCGEDLMGIPYGEFSLLQCPACGQYLDGTKVITRADAEAALSGGDNDGR